jgi:hypothetical protein
MPDWYEKTRTFQRAVAKGDGKLEDKVIAGCRWTCSSLERSSSW